MWFSKAKEGAAESVAPSTGARSAARPKARRRATATSHSDWGEKYIAGVPARIMRPRLVFLSCLIAICMFGLLMIYSASSVESLQENGSSWFFLYRQAIFMFIGFVLFAAIGSRLLPWPLFRSRLVWGVWFGVLVLLIAVLFVGQGAEEWGASRWIDLGIFNLQPAEVAKPVIIVLTAKIFADYFEDGTIDTRAFLIQMLIMLPFPLFLIFREPDLGTTIIIALTVFAIAILCGLPWRVVAFVTIAAFVLGAAAIVTSPYRAKRFLAFLDPWSDPYDTGYQATLAIMAFASGGLFGRGIGNSTMKYHYLPEAHNDYILAIIGEELGFVGTAIFVLVFAAMIIAAFYICREAPTLHAQLLASGCTIILAVQFLINVFGILGVMPMTGKPLPFVSYGGLVDYRLARARCADIPRLGREQCRDRGRSSPFRHGRDGGALRRSICAPFRELRRRCVGPYRPQYRRRGPRPFDPPRRVGSSSGSRRFESIGAERLRRRPAGPR